MLEIYTLVTPDGHVLDIYTLVTPGGYVLEIYTLVTPGGVSLLVTPSRKCLVASLPSRHLY